MIRSEWMAQQHEYVLPHGSHKALLSAKFRSSVPAAKGFAGVRDGSADKGSQMKQIFSSRLQPKLEDSVEQWLGLSKPAALRTMPGRPAAKIVRKFESSADCLQHLQRGDPLPDDDAKLETYDAELLQEISALEGQLNTVKQEHLSSRSAMMQDLRCQWAATTARSAIDAAHLMDIAEFDPSEPSRLAADMALLQARDNCRTERETLRLQFDRDRAGLERKIRDLRAGGQEEEERHRIMVARLQRKLASARSGSNGAETGEPQSPLRGATAGSHGGNTAGSHRSRVTTSGSHQSRGSFRSTPRSGKWRSTVLESPPKVLTATERRATKELTPHEPSHLWGGLVVGWIGLDSYPSKPQQWRNAMAQTNRLQKPRMARSMDEVLASRSDRVVKGPALDGSLAELERISRYLQGDSGTGLTPQPIGPRGRISKPSPEGVTSG